MNERIASLEAQLQAATDLHQRVDLLNALSAELSFSEPARAIEWAAQARRLASSEGDEPIYPAGLAASLFNLARAHNQRGEYIESLSCLVEAQPHYEALNDENGLMWLFNEFGRLYYFLSDYPNALSCYYRTLQLAQKISHTNRQAASLNNIGLVHSSTGNYDQALETLQQGLDIASRAGDRWVEGFLLGSLAEVHYHRKEYDRALDYGLRSVDLARLNGTPTLISGALLAVSWTYFELGDYDRAQACLQEVRQTAQGSGDQRGLAEAQRAVGEQANRRGVPAEALPALEEALALAVSLGEKALQANCHRALADSYRQLGQYQKALEHYEAYHELDKAVFNEKSDLRLKTLDVVHRLQVARQDAEIYRLRNQMLQQEVEEQHRIQRALEELANRDALTGLLNRRAFFQQGESLFHTRRKSQRPLALLMLDIDHFKAINDRYGHMVGDEVLSAFAALLRQNLRPVDLLCRYGGEEFAILMPGMGAARAEKVARRLCHMLAGHSFQAGQAVIQITVSVGVAEAKPGTVSLDGLILMADQALYAAKQAGRNCVRISG